MSYHRDWIGNRLVRKTADLLLSNGFISEEQKNKTYEQFKDQFYSPNLFIRIGLFIFTLVLANAALGIVGSGLVAFFSDEFFFGIIMIVGGGIYILALEHFIKSKFHYRSGMDDCLLYMAVVFFVIGFAVILKITDPLGIAILCMPFLIFSSYRYADAFLAVLAFACLYIIVFLLATKSDYGKLFLPFIYLVLSAILVYLLHGLIKSDKLFYWKNSLNTLKFFALLGLYLSVNYYVVKEGNAALNAGYAYTTLSPEAAKVQSKIDENNRLISELTLKEMDEVSEETYASLIAENDILYTEFGTIINNDIANSAAGRIPFQFLFIAFTFIIPVAFVFFGLQKKDRLLLWTSMLTMIFTFSTLFYYFKYIPVEMMMAITGLFLLLVSYLSIRYLKINGKHFTYEAEESQNLSGILNAEGLIIGSTLGSSPISDSDNVKFGGGSYGGGGAGGSY